MILLIDVGNTRAKASFYIANQKCWLDLPGFVHAHSEVDPIRIWENWKNAIEKHLSSSQSLLLDAVGIASVNQAISSLLVQSCPDWAKKRWVTAQTNFEFRRLKNAYATPSNMGVDRWLAMIAASDGGKHACLVVDAGTALTLDWVAPTGEHLGGYILPGLNQQLTALLGSTERVFAGRWSDSTGLVPGKDTSECVLNGLLTQMCAFIAAQAAQAAHQGIKRLVLTGGETSLLVRHLEPLITQLNMVLEIRPRLVFEGLLTITEKLDKKS
jgi:type III pantothenate kinase